MKQTRRITICATVTFGEVDRNESLSDRIRNKRLLFRALLSGVVRASIFVVFGLQHGQALAQVTAYLGPVPATSTVYFDADRAALGPEAQALLDDWAAYLTSQETIASIVLHGHADKSDGDGGEAYMLGFSERRAGAVRDYLVQLGVSGERISMMGFGLNFPIQGASAQENRRVTIQFEAGLPGAEARYAYLQELSCMDQLLPSEERPREALSENHQGHEAEELIFDASAWRSPRSIRIWPEVDEAIQYAPAPPPDPSDVTFDPKALEDRGQWEKVARLQAAEMPENEVYRDLLKYRQPLVEAIRGDTVAVKRITRVLAVRTNPTDISNTAKEVALELCNDISTIAFKLEFIVQINPTRFPHSEQVELFSTIKQAIENNYASTAQPVSVISANIIEEMNENVVFAISGVGVWDSIVDPFLIAGAKRIKDGGLLHELYWNPDRKTIEAEWRYYKEEQEVSEKVMASSDGLSTETVQTTRTKRSISYNYEFLEYDVELLKKDTPLHYHAVEFSTDNGSAQGLFVYAKFVDPENAGSAWPLETYCGGRERPNNNRHGNSSGADCLKWSNDTIVLGPEGEVTVSEPRFAKLGEEPLPFCAKKRGGQSVSGAIGSKLQT